MISRKSDPTDKNSPKKVYLMITYKYATPVTQCEIAKEIGSTSDVGDGETISELNDFSTLLYKGLFEGHLVNIKGLDFFYLTPQGKGKNKIKDFTANNITGLRVCFRANNDNLLDTGILTHTDRLKLKDMDHINKPDTEEVPDGGEVKNPSA